MNSNSPSVADLIRSVEAVVGVLRTAVHGERLAAILHELEDQGFALRFGSKTDRFIQLAQTDPAAARAFLLGNPDILVPPWEVTGN